MNNHLPKNTTGNTAVIESLFTEMRERKAGEIEKKPTETTKKFETLPDGNYTGRVHVEIGVIGSENSPNYGRSKYEIRLNVTEGEFKGKLAYNHRIILPYNLADAPPSTAVEAVKGWKTEAAEWMEQTDQILKNCGIDTSDKDMARFTLRIAENNRRNQIVNFKMRNGVPYVNGLAQGTDTNSDELFKEQTLPDGNDAPID